MNTSMNIIKKEQLVEIIKSIVRQSIQERKDKWIQKAVDPSHKGYCTPMTKSTCTPRRKALAKRFKKGIEDEQVGGNVVAEVAPPGFGPDKTHADIYNKVMKQYSGEPEKAYPTMWKIYNKMTEATNMALEECGVMDEAGLTSEEGNPAHEHSEEQLIKVLHHVAKKLKAMHKEKGGEKVDEASYKVVSPTSSQVQKDNQALKVQTEPKVNEASYKVVSPTSAQVQKDNQALKVQTEPKVNEENERPYEKRKEFTCPHCKTKQIRNFPWKKGNICNKCQKPMNETAYKTQGPSYKTFGDSPQIPDAVNNPENA